MGDFRKNLVFVMVIVRGYTPLYVVIRGYTQVIRGYITYDWRITGV